MKMPALHNVLVIFAIIKLNISVLLRTQILKLIQTLTPPWFHHRPAAVSSKDKLHIAWKHGSFIFEIIVGFIIIFINV